MSCGAELSLPRRFNLFRVAQASRPNFCELNRRRSDSQSPGAFGHQGEAAARTQ